jgi:long-chain acyl-CoA synthetase
MRYNRPMNLAAFADQNLATFGEYERLVFEGERVTNRQLHERSCRLANGLRAAGIGAGDKVVVLMMNSPDVLVSYPAIWRAGGVVIPVLFLLETEEVRYVLAHSGARAVITSPKLRDKVARAAEGTRVEHIIVTGDPAAVAGGALAFETLVADNDPDCPVAERAPSDVAVILYTSGTTGKPKGVMQTHHNLVAACQNSYESSGRKTRDQTSLLVLPLAHSFGLAVLVGGYLFGGKAVLMRWFEPEQALRLIQEHGVQAMAGVPTMFVYMLHHPNAGAYDTSTMERWLVGGAPMPSQQLAQFEQRFGGVMYVGYGLTEASPGIATEREGMPRKPGSCGVVMEGVEVKIVDDTGAEVPRGELGEVCARGENISPGYHEMPDATSETFRDGWLYTGDVGKLDDDGYLFIVERKKDLIIRGGFNVYPKDVEDVLHRHAAVQECAVVGVPNDELGEQVCAFVVAAPGAEVTPAALIAHCQEHLAKYKSPRHVWIVPALPKTNIGKIQKKQLRQLAAERVGT